MTPATALTWTPDVLDGVEQATLAMPRSRDGGDDDIVLVPRRTQLTNGCAVLYVHGFGDYVVQRHLTDFVDEQGLRFRTADLRRHGRAIRSHPHPDTCRGIDEYVDHIDSAVELLRVQEGVDWLLVNGHSSGGLAAVIHAHHGAQRSDVDPVLHTGPFLDMNLPGVQEMTLEPVLVAAGSVPPELSPPSLDPLRGDSIHSSARGVWGFDLVWKPLAGFPATSGWSRGIHRAQAEVAHGPPITAALLPCPPGAACDRRGAPSTSGPPTSRSTSPTCTAPARGPDRAPRCAPCRTASTTRSGPSGDRAP